MKEKKHKPHEQAEASEAGQSEIQPPEEPQPAGEEGISEKSFEELESEAINAAREEVATCAISGAVGTFANIDPRIEEYVAEKLGLTPEPVSTQVIPRDRHAAYFATLGVVLSALIIAVVAIVQELRKKPEDRTWHGTVADFDTTHTNYASGAGVWDPSSTPESVRRRPATSPQIPAPTMATRISRLYCRQPASAVSSSSCSARRPW